MRSALAASAELAARVDQLSFQVKRHGGKLVAHDATILRLLADIRQLTQFPGTCIDIRGFLYMSGFTCIGRSEL